MSSCINRGGHVYQQVDANTWKCVYCGKRYTFDDESKGWS